MSPPPDAAVPVAIARESVNTMQFGVVPICIVPGVMGTRLEFHGIPPTSWDPDSKAWMLAFAAMPTSMKTYLFGCPGTVMNDPSDKHAALVQAFYRPIIDELEKLDQKQHPVYSIGYDWRKSNRESGAKIAAEVRSILEKHRAQKAILVTHSMGGLASRAALKFSGLEKDVLGVVHAVQPALGAAKNYSNFMRGPNEPGFPEGFVLEQILGPAGWQFAAHMSSLPGPVQLLPNQEYRLPKDGVTVEKPDLFKAEIPADEWLQVYWDDEHTRSGFGNDIFDVYSSPGIPGVLKSYDTHLLPEYIPPTWNGVMERLKDNLWEAKHFHEDLGSYEHPMTKVIYSESNTTLLGTIIYRNLLSPFGLTYGQFLGKGDGTVPLVSQLALPEQGGWPPQLEHPQGLHAEIFKVPEARQRVVQCIQGMVAEYFHGKPPAP